LSGERLGFPEGVTDDERRIKASWLKEAALKGVAIDISNAIVSEVADFRTIRFENDVRILKTRFEGLVDLSYSQFQRTANFTGSVFSGGVCFDSTRFLMDTSLARAIFCKRTDSPEAELSFNDAEFAGVLDATDAQFPDDALVSFVRSRFRKSTYFASARFSGPVDLSSAESESALDFREARFRRFVRADYLRVGNYFDLSRTRFKRTAPVSLREIKVEGSVCCDAARFGSSLDLSASRIGSSFSAVGACFFGATRLAGTTILGNANLESSRFGRHAPAIFTAASVGGHIYLSRALFKSRVDFSDVTASNFAIREARFLGAATFTRARLAGWLEMMRSRFEHVNFKDLHAEGTVDCTGVVFRGAVNGHEARLGGFVFTGQAQDAFDLYGVEIKGMLNLAGACFRGRRLALDIAGVSVATQAYLDGARFYGKLNAIGLSIEQQFSFNRVVCRGEVDFYELVVKRGFFVWESRFRSSFKLDSAIVSGEVYLSGARFRGDASFSGSTIRAVHMAADKEHGGRAAEFSGNLSLRAARLGYLGFHGVRCTSEKKTYLSTPWR
jgi:uncharacterized protein YjbI with pentapeptide repeats